jgi:nucleoside-diphosphate-sugar epimerase
VTITVRTEEKGRQVLARHTNTHGAQIAVAIVPDFTKPGAFDTYLKSNSGLDAVIHVASPFYYSATDIRRELLDPSIIGTTALLEAIRDHASSVKTVVRCRPVSVAGPTLALELLLTVTDRLFFLRFDTRQL